VKGPPRSISAGQVDHRRTRRKTRVGVRTLFSTARTSLLADASTSSAAIVGLAPVCSHLPTHLAYTRHVGGVAQKKLGGPALTPMGIDGPFYSVDGGRRQSPHTRSKSVGPVAGVRDWLKSRSSEWRRSARLHQHNGPQRDPDTGAWISAAEVAETSYTMAESGTGAITARLIVRRVKDAHHPADGLFPIWAGTPFITNSTEPATDADLTHRRHAIIETTFADLIDGPLAHLPSGRFRRQFRVGDLRGHRA
jgi:hypothetical protein